MLFYLTQQDTALSHANPYLSIDVHLNRKQSTHGIKPEWRSAAGSVKAALVTVTFVCLWSDDDQVCADGEPAGADQTVPVLPTCGAEQKGPAGGRRGPLLPEPQEGSGDGLSVN